MKRAPPSEDHLIRSVALRNAHSILAARQRAERDLIEAKAALEEKTQELEELLAIHKRAEGAQAQLAAIVTSSHDAIISKDTSGRITSWNEAAQRLYGYTELEAVGQPIMMLIPPDRAEEETSILARLLRGERIENLETVRVSKSGRRIDVSVTVSPVRDGSGRVIGASKIARDITARLRTDKALRESEAVNRFLADASASLSGLADSDSALSRVVNLAVPIFADWCAVDLTGPDGELHRIGLSPADTDQVEPGTATQPGRLNFPPDHAVIARVFRTGVTECIADGPDDFISTPRTDRDLQNARRIGVKSLLCCPLRSQAGTHGVISFATLESGRVYSSADLVAAEDLANRAAIAIENGSLLAALKEGDRRKDEFLAMLAHELRNPLAPIRNALHIIRVKAVPSPQVQWARDVIERQVSQLNHLVDDLLDVSRITNGKIELRRQRVDIGTVINSAIEASRPVIEKFGHQFTVSVPEQQICLDADLTRIAQVLSNLLNNAAKYTPPGGHIALTANLDGSDVVLLVKDDGIGVSPEVLPRIFDMFTQADSSLERSQGGLGIGLTLVQLLVELHGGSVQARSDGLGTGSEFEVRLPTHASQAVDDDALYLGLSETLATIPKHNILVVDDNKDAAESLAMLLRLTGSEVHTAHDGLEAIDAVLVFRPDVVILDIGLPRLNGYEVARRLRDEHGDSIQLIALTGWGQVEDRRRSMEAGFDHHLTKPIGMDSLKEVLAKAEDGVG